LYGDVGAWQKQEPDRRSPRTRADRLRVGHCGGHGTPAETCRSRLIEPDDSDAFLDSSTDDGGGTIQRRILLIFYAVWASAPARVPSPKQLSTDHDYAVPTREYQSDQSSVAFAPSLSSACCPKPKRGAQSSSAGTCFHLRRPSRF